MCRSYADTTLLRMRDLSILMLWRLQETLEPMTRGHGGETGMCLGCSLKS